MKKTKQLEKLIKNIDLFASPVELMINKKRSHQALFGSIITLILIGCVCAYIINKFIQLGQHKDFQTLYSEVYYEEIPVYPLKKTNFTLQFAFQDSTQLNYVNESIYQVKATLVNKITTIVNNKTNYIITNDDIPLTKCNTIGIPFTELEEQLSTTDLTNTYCIDWDNINQLNLIGSSEQSNYTYIKISFTECVNQTDNNICSPKEVIDSVLHRNYIQFQISSYNIDLRDYLKPQVPKIEEIQTTISSQVLKDVTIFMQPITTLTESGLLDELTRADSSIRYQKNSEIIDFNSDDTLATVIIRLSNTENISYRIYPKLQDILASAGGLWELMMLFCTFIARPFQQLSYKLDIINSLFNFEGQQDTSNDKGLINSLTIREETINSQGNESIILKSSEIIKSSRFPRGRTIKQLATMHSIKNDNQSQGSNEISLKNITRNIRQVVRKLFKVSNLKITLSTIDFLKYLKCGKKEGKLKQLQYSIGKLEKCLDILFIINKLQEIDKLKMLLLTKQQLQLFEYLPKPLICLDPNNQKQNEQLYYSSLLRPYKSLKEKAQEAQLVLDELLENLNDPINSKLIQLMDPNIIKLAELQNELKKKQQVILSTETSGQ